MIKPKKCKCGARANIEYDFICHMPLVLVVCPECKASCEGVTFFSKEDNKIATETAIQRWNSSTHKKRGAAGLTAPHLTKISNTDRLTKKE